MFIPITLALSALSGVESLIESAASKGGKALGNEFAKLAPGAAGNSLQPSSSPAVPAASRFDFGTLSALLSVQGQNGANAGGRADALFAKLDADGDGQVSKTEFEGALGKAGIDTARADALFARFDANGDGCISKSELAPQRAAYLHRRHHGGAVTPSAVDAAA
jgi:hypothetical protein